MKVFNKAFIYLFCLVFTFSSQLNAKSIPDSFAELAEKLMPSVVNISTTQTIRTTTNQFPFQFPPGSPFEEMFKDFQRPTERKASSLGSGFIIDKNGTIVTNNHVIANAEDILVRVNSKEFSNIGRSVHSLAVTATNRFEETRDLMKKYINAKSREEIIFTKNATEAINLVASTYGDKFINKGDEILITELEHHANYVPWHFLRQKKGAVIKFA